jgi:peroxiredoxin
MRKYRARLKITSTTTEGITRVATGAIILGTAAFVVASIGCSGVGTTPNSNSPVAKSEQAQVLTSHSESKSHDTQQAADPSTTASEPSAESKQTIAGSAEANTIEQSANDSSTQVTTLKPPIVRPAAMPKVLMSSAHAADCIVRVSDAFPDFRLPDAGGRSRSLQDVQGAAMTVVVLWSGDRLLAEDQLRYLDEKIAQYADLGVRAVAINVGDGFDEVRTTLDSLRLKTPILLDRDRGLFSRVGINHLPRTYLLDRDGRILWFDIEFSRRTREDLEQAINASLNST